MIELRFAEKKAPARPQARSAGAIFAGLLLIGAFSGCSTPKVESQNAMVMTVPVTVATAVRKTVPVELRAIGNAEAYSTVSVKSQVEGQLERVYFHEGQDVRKGDLLFTIDARPFETALRQAEANQARDSAQAEHARSDAGKFLKLAEGGIASREQYDEARTQAEALEALVRADRAVADNARLQLGYCAIRSPIDGRTGSLIVHPGNILKANDAALVVINQTDPVYVNFSVPEKYLPEIKKHLAAGRLRVAAAAPGDEQHPSQGYLTFVDNTVEAATGTIRLKGTFSNAERRLWPGQFVNVVLALTSLPNAVVVPSQAVQTGQRGQYSFVVKPDLTVDLRPVVTGETIGGETVIEKGLQPGEKVVTDGQLLLLPGAKVEVKESSEK
jgi:membrane fusion protein, multidrug efflux system